MNCRARKQMSDDNKTVATPEEVTAKVIEEFGFDPDTQGEQIEKLTNERIENQKNLSKTIEQKAKYREIGVKKGILDPNTFEPIEKKPEGNLNKTNTGQAGLSREETIFFAQGGTEQEFEDAKLVANRDNVSLLVAREDPYVKFQKEQRDKEVQIKKNQISGSGGAPTGSGHQPKQVGEMTRNEHMAHMKEECGTR